MRDFPWQRCQPVGEQRADPMSNALLAIAGVGASRKNTMMRASDLKLFHVFLAIAEHRSLTVAAERLGLTQPAISHALRRLRELLDDPLFVRVPSGMAPTEVARQLVVPLTEAFMIINQALQQRVRFEPSTADRTFKIAMSDMAELFFLPSLIARLAQDAPRVRLEVTQVSAENLNSLMRTGAVDLALGFMPDLGAGIVSETLFHDEHACIVRAGHPLRRRAPRPSELANLRYVVADNSASGHRNDALRLEGLGFRPNVAVRLPHFTIACYITQHTDLAVFIPRGIAEYLNRGRAFRIFPLPFALPRIKVQVHSHAQFASDPGVAWLRAVILDLFGQHEEQTVKNRTGR